MPVTAPDLPVENSDAYSEFSMYITKASIHHGVMRWSAVNSDTDPDSYQERMSRELFEDFISRIENEDEIPEPFRKLACSEYWCGGMPYVSISHYSDQGGRAVPGEVLELFVDGDKLKAKGILYDNSLGLSVWRSLREDKVKPPDEKIRISIGFLDLAHRHGDGKVWVRESLNSLCPECLEGIGNKVYIKGYLVHLALTRVPVNKRTEMVLEEKSMTKVKKTRKDDAESIVGEQAEVLDKGEEAMKSNAMVEMSDSEKPEGGEEVAEIETEKPETPPEPETQPEPVQVDASQAKTEKTEPGMEGYAMPFGGATSMKDAHKYVEAKEEMVHLMDLWSMFSQVAWNIFDRNDVSNKKAEFSKAIDEFKSMLASKAMLTFSQAAPVVELSDVSHPLQPAIDAFLKEVDNSAVLKSEGERAQVVNPAFQALGKAIADYLAEKSQGSVEQEPPAHNKEIVDEIKNLSQLVLSKMEDFNSRLGLVETQRAQTAPVNSRVPVRKSLTPDALRQATPAQPQGLKSIIRKSVGLQE